MKHWIGNRLAVLSTAAALGIAAQVSAQQGEKRGTEKTRDAVQVIDTTEGLALDEAQKVHVRITNDLVPTRSVIVSVFGGTRPEYALGTVLSNETKEWVVDSRAYAGGMRLVATSGAHDVRVSRRIHVTNFASVRWGLTTGIVRVERIAPKEDAR